MSIWNVSEWFSFFVSAALKSTAVLGAAWLAAWALRGRSAALRHLVWTAAAAAVLALPFLSASLPALRVPASGALLPFDPAVVFRVGSSAAAEQPSSSLLPSASARRAIHAPRYYDWRIWLMLLWAAGAAGAFLRMFAAFIAVWRVQRAARPFPDDGLARALAQSLGIRHHVGVLESRPGGMPMTFGLLRPAVFMPPEAAAWSEERRRIVLLHELAHVRRGDVATHLLARTALSLNWWNPLAWSAWREFLKERERATDDLVLNAGARASDYAGHLLEVARTLQSAPATAWAAVAMARRSQLEGRLLAILDSGVKRHVPGRMAALAATLLAIAAVAPFAAMQAQTPAQQTAPAATSPETSGAPSADDAGGLVKLGDQARQQGHLDEAIGYYNKAVAAVGDRPETAVALLYLGAATYGKNPAQALEYFERAQNVAPYGPMAGPAMTWQAMVKQHQEGEAAESLYRAALAIEQAKSPEAALTMEFLASFLREQGRVTEAEAMEASASEIRETHVAQLSPKRQATAQISKVGNGVSAPMLLHKVEPSYSLEARAAKVQGMVLLYVVIGADGRASDVQLRKGVGYGLDEQALDAVTQWTFKPGTRDGMAVPVQAMIEVNFRLL
ncbi:MAG: TonB family protein [Bryobacteraceae bacterium]|jgi:TonB family protein